MNKIIVLSLLTVAMVGCSKNDKSEMPLYTQEQIKEKITSAEVSPENIKNFESVMGSAVKLVETFKLNTSGVQSSNNQQGTVTAKLKMKKAGQVCNISSNLNEKSFESIGSGNVQMSASLGGDSCPVVASFKVNAVLVDSEPDSFSGNLSVKVTDSSWNSSSNIKQINGVIRGGNLQVADGDSKSYIDLNLTMNTWENESVQFLFSATGRDNNVGPENVVAFINGPGFEFGLVVTDVDGVKTYLLNNKPITESEFKDMMQLLEKYSEGLSDGFPI